MHRLFATTDNLILDVPTLAREEEKHLKVLRPNDGESVELFDGCGHARVFRWSAAARRLCPAEPLRTLPRRAGRLVLFACVTKGSRWDWTIEKAVELGVTEIVPVLSARCVVRLAADERAAKAERWRRVAADALRQSDGMWLPDVAVPDAFEAVLPRVRALAHTFVGALTEPPPAALLDAAAALSPGEDCGLFVGPEGDFAPEELSALLAIATPVTFGPTVLRAETAAIFGLSVLAALGHRREERVVL